MRRFETVPYFYATADDLLPVFTRVEAKRNLVYTLCGLFDSYPAESFHRGEQLPSLRLPPEGPSSNSCASYLVTPTEVTVNIREVPQNTGGICYAVDQLYNPESIEINHGGRPESGILLAGRIDTCTGSKVSNAMLRAYKNAMARTFCRIRAFWVGPEARELLASGCRLTQAAYSPPEYDLTP